MSRSDSVQSIINELAELKQRSPRLSKRDRKRAAELFVSLRRIGYIAREISELTGGVWKEAAIKPYIVGIQPDPDSKGPQADLSSLSQARSLGLSNDMIEQANRVKKIIDKADVPLRDVAELTAEITSAGMSSAELVSTVKQLKISGMAIADLGISSGRITRIQDLTRRILL